MSHVQTNGLSHVQIAVADLDRAAGFYVDALGLEQRGHAGGLRFLGTPGLADNLALAAGEHGGSGGVNHFGFMLRDAPRDLDGSLARIEAAGGVVVERFELFPGWPSAVFLDPDGFRVQV